MDGTPFRDLPAQEQLRLRRRALGLSQKAVAERVGTSQSALAAIEAGKRGMSEDMEHKLWKALAARPSELLRRHRESLLEAADVYGLHNVQVFGSVARGEDREDSDLDLMVEIDPRRRGFLPTVAFAEHAERLLGVPVDVILKPTFKVEDRPSAQRLLREAIAA